MSGKGDTRRPASVDRATLDANWARAFGNWEMSPNGTPRPPLHEHTWRRCADRAAVECTGCSATVREIEMLNREYFGLDE